jgi:uncharacterized membrane protein
MGRGTSVRKDTNMTMGFDSVEFRQKTRFRPGLFYWSLQHSLKKHVWILGGNSMRKHLTWILIVIPFLGMILANVIAWPELGDRIPIHFNARGEADSWGGKGSIWILPGIFLWSSFLLGVATMKGAGSDDPSHRKAIHWLQVGLGMLFLYLQAGLLQLAGEPSPNLTLMFINMGLGIFMLSLSQTLKHCKRNSFIGVRTKWTLASDENWEKTHRFASSAFNTAGVFVAFYSFLTSGIFLAISLITVIYSYRLNKIKA